jgi:hypothetical protein
VQNLWTCVSFLYHVDMCVLLISCGHRKIGQAMGLNAYTHAVTKMYLLYIIVFCVIVVHFVLKYFTVKIYIYIYKYITHCVNMNLDIGVFFINLLTG